MSPKTIFIAVLGAGLPSAVLAGWALGAPGPRTATVVVTPGVDAGARLGGAPAPLDDSPSVQPSRQAAGEHPPRESAGLIVATTAAHRVPSSPAPTARTARTRQPALNVPPVPTPTQAGQPDPATPPFDDVVPDDDLAPSSEPLSDYQDLGQFPAGGPHRWQRDRGWRVDAGPDPARFGRHHNWP
ncbi:hypothetical protein [Actinoplanes sp. NPDC051851]|uniref:hypothetical protein n=1 Tax=Actinoplanes sp. NPDC051851 TaxID=3154753 RepID=UPI003420AAA0